jgi:histidinol phosphatase-like PHP family hydrolase
MLCDFHTHSFHSDGILSPIELIRYACVHGYRALAITDHVGIGSLERVVGEVAADCALAMKHWKIVAVSGVELTHLPAAAIDDAAWRAREAGASIVVVHGQTVAEPVEEGTNLAAIKSRHVDILAHPGRLTEKEAELAAETGTFLELSGRKSHGSTNAHVAGLAVRFGARLLVNSDAHADTDLLSEDSVRQIIRAAGLAEDRQPAITMVNPGILLKKLGYTLTV